MITRDEARLHCRAESFSEEDTLFDSLISAAYAAAEQMTGRAILERTETLVLDRFPRRHHAHKRADHGMTIELPWTPVQSIDSVQYVDTDGVTQYLDVDSLLFDTRQLFPTLSPQWETKWPDTIDEPESVTITATVGYSDDDMPGDIRAAMLLLIGHLYANRETVTIGSAGIELPMGTSALLSHYRVHRVG